MYFSKAFWRLYKVFQGPERPCASFPVLRVPLDMTGCIRRVYRGCISGCMPGGQWIVVDGGSALGHLPSCPPKLCQCCNLSSQCREIYPNVIEKAHGGMQRQSVYSNNMTQYLSNHITCILHLASTSWSLVCARSSSISLSCFLRASFSSSVSVSWLFLGTADTFSVPSLLNISLQCLQAITLPWNSKVGNQLLAIIQKRLLTMLGWCFGSCWEDEVKLGEPNYSAGCPFSSIVSLHSSTAERWSAKWHLSRGLKGCLAY